MQAHHATRNRERHNQREKERERETVAHNCSSYSVFSFAHVLSFSNGYIRKSNSFVPIVVFVCAFE